jgi:hypothetical protein
VNSLLTPSLIGRYSIKFLLENWRPEFMGEIVEGDEVRISSIDLPFGAAERNKTIDDYITNIVYPEVKKLAASLRDARRTYAPPIPSADKTAKYARHQFDGACVLAVLHDEKMTLSVAHE